MSKRLPKVSLSFGKLSDTRLIAVAQSAHDGLAANAGDFPAPPIAVLDLQAYIDDYKNACATAFKGTKLDTSMKIDFKKVLVDALRANGTYVNQIVFYRWYNYVLPFSYDAAKSLILLSGFLLSKDPNPVGQIMNLIIQETSSMNPGEIYIRVKVYEEFKKNIKSFNVQYRKVIPPVPPATNPTYGMWQAFTFTDSRMTLVGLDSGFKYQIKIAGIGGTSKRDNTTTNFTPIMERVII